MTAEVSDNTSHQMVCQWGGQRLSRWGVRADLGGWQWTHCMSQPCRYVCNSETKQPGYWQIQISEWLKMGGFGSLCSVASQLEAWQEQRGIWFPHELNPTSKTHVQRSKQNIVLHVLTKNVKKRRYPSPKGIKRKLLRIFPVAYPDILEEQLQSTLYNLAWSESREWLQRLDAHVTEGRALSFSFSAF